MTFQLRDYQQKFADSIIKLLAQFKRIIACAATGSGKTKTFIYLAKRAQSKGLTVLIITEATKIYDQLTAEVPETGNINAEVSDGYIQQGHIYIAMAQTLARRPKMVQQFTIIGNRLLIINDEAHIGTATKLLQSLIVNEPLLIGFTATPDFKFAKHLPLLYNAISIGPQSSELINEGYLSPYRHYARVLANLDELKMKNGEFTEESQEAIFESKKVYDGLCVDLKTQPFKKAVVFTASIKHCEATTAQLLSAGFNAIQIHSRINPQQQSFDMKQYRDPNSGIDICVSVGILTKGWDFPAVDLVILDRATTSLPLYLQMIGRGSRIDGGKHQFTVLDYGGNYSRHGLWDADIDWSKKWKEKPKKKDGVAPVKNCPKCEAIVPVSVMVCKYCGHLFEPPAPNEEDIERTKLIELTEKYHTITGKRISQLTPNELALYAKLKNKKAFAARVAKAQEQEKPGWLEEFATNMGYKSGWAYFQSKDLAQSKIEFHDIILR